MSRHWFNFPFLRNPDDARAPDSPSHLSLPFTPKIPTTTTRMSAIPEESTSSSTRSSSSVYQQHSVNVPYSKDQRKYTDVGTMSTKGLFYLLVIILFIAITYIIYHHFTIEPDSERF